jgi:hypothetical protein
MKTILKFVTVPAVAIALLVAATPNTARAEGYYRHHEHRGNDGAAVAIVAGIAAVGLIAALASNHDRDYAPRAYCPPPPPPQRWVPGHYETRQERVCIPGYWDTVVEPAQWAWVRHGHRAEYVMVRPECARRVWIPERYEWRTTQIWVPGRFEVARAY